MFVLLPSSSSCIGSEDSLIPSLKVGPTLISLESISQLKTSSGHIFLLDARLPPWFSCCPLGFLFICCPLTLLCLLMAHISGHLSKFKPTIGLSPLLLSHFPRDDVLTDDPVSPFSIRTGAWAIISQLLSSDWLTASPNLINNCCKWLFRRKRTGGNPGTE